MIGIIGAMQVEINKLASQMKHSAKFEFGGTTYFMGKLHDRHLVLVCSGIGKVNAAIVATTLVHKFGATLIINTGVAGGVGRNIKIGDVVIAKACVQFDVMVDTTNGGRLGAVDKIFEPYIPCHGKLVETLASVVKELQLPVYVGTVASSDRFITDHKLLDDIRDKFDPLAVEMESGAIAHVCHLYKVPFTTVRIISDAADGNAESDFGLNMSQMADIGCDIVHKLFGIYGQYALDFYID